MTPAPNREGLRQFVVYDNPSDYPGKFVVRGWTITAGHVQPDTLCQLADDIDGARALVPDHLGLVNIGRQPEDDPTIVEVWT